MAIFLLITLLVAFVGMKAAKPGEFHKDYISINQTTSINGLFTLLVFWSHVCTYIALTAALTSPTPSSKATFCRWSLSPSSFTRATALWNQ